MTTGNDQALLDAARDGDPNALGDLIARYQARVYRFGMKMCRHPEDAEDILQETLLAAARSIGDFRGGASLSTWLYTIARSFCIKKRRKSKYAPDREHSLEAEVEPEGEALAHPGQSPDELAHARHLRAALDRALEALEPEQREVLLLRDFEGLKASEVSQIVGISVPAVKSRLHRARAKVAELVRPLVEVPAPQVPAPTSCPDVLKLYSQKLEDEISADLCAQMERHLDTCPSCQAKCDSLKETVALCAAQPAAPVPPQVRDALQKSLREFLKSGS